MAMFETLKLAIPVGCLGSADATCGWKIHGGNNIGPNPPCLDDSFWQRHFWNQCESHIGNPEVMPYKSNQLLSFRIGHPTVDAVDSPHLQMSTGKNHPFWDTPLMAEELHIICCKRFYMVLHIHLYSCSIIMHMFNSHIFPYVTFHDFPWCSQYEFHYFSLFFHCFPGAVALGSPCHACQARRHLWPTVSRQRHKSYV